MGIFRTGGLVTALLFVALTIWMASQRDLPAAPDEDLVPSYAPLSARENAWPLLAEAAAEIGISEAENEAFGCFARGEASHEALAHLVPRHAEALTKAERALRRPHMRLPKPAPRAELPAAMELPRIANLLALRAAGRAQRGDREGAYEDLLAVLALGQRLHAAERAALVEASMGLAMQSLALKHLARLLAEGPAPPGVAAALEGGLVRGAEGQHIWAGEYAFTRRAILGLEEVDTRELLEGSAGSGLALFPRRYLFHPNRTLALFAPVYRSFASTSCREDLAEHSSERPGLLVMLGPNSIGEILFRVGTPNFQRFHRRACAHEARGEATQTMMALRAYQEQHGELPGTLESLVPEFAERLPRDPFTGRALGYSPSKRWLWSAGSDGLDEGGQAAPAGPMDFSEPTFPLPF